MVAAASAVFLHAPGRTIPGAPGSARAVERALAISSVPRRTAVGLGKKASLLALVLRVLMLSQLLLSLRDDWHQSRPRRPRVAHRKLACAVIYKQTIQCWASNGQGVRSTSAQ